MSKFWVFVAPSGMPVEVRKCEFEPTIRPHDGKWERVFREDELKQMDALEARINGLIDAQRPLLEEWARLRGKA